MKRSLRFIAILIAIVLVVGCIPNKAQAAELRSSAYFARAGVFIFKASTDTYEAWFDVIANYSMDKIGSSYIAIQQSPDNTNWTTIQRCYPEDYPQMLCESTARHTAGVPFDVTSGYYYRAYVEIYAKYGNGSAYDWLYTESVYCPY